MGERIENNRSFENFGGVQPSSPFPQNGPSNSSSSSSSPLPPSENWLDNPESVLNHALGSSPDSQNSNPSASQSSSTSATAQSTLTNNIKNTEKLKEKSEESRRSSSSDSVSSEEHTASVKEDIDLEHNDFDRSKIEVKGAPTAPKSSSEASLKTATAQTQWNADTETTGFHLESQHTTSAPWMTQEGEPTAPPRPFSLQTRSQILGNAAPRSGQPAYLASQLSKDPRGNVETKTLSKEMPFTWEENKLGGYGPGGNLYDILIGNSQKDEVYAMRSQVRKAEQQLKQKMHIVMFQLLMGDVEGAVRQLIAEAERYNTFFNRLLVKQLGRVRDAKGKILLALGRKRPPTSSGDPAKYDQDKKAQDKYNQWVSLSSQLLGTMNEGEHDLMTLIDDGRKNISDMWDAYKGLKEAEARTDRNVFQSFRG